MNQFYFSAQTTPSTQSKVTGKSGGDGNASSALQLQTAKLYSARLETLGNVITGVKVAVGKQTVTVPLPSTVQLPAGIKPGQSYQVSFGTNKSGQPEITFYPQAGEKNPQTVKINVSDAQLVNLLTLGKAFKANADGSVQTQGKIVLNPQNAPALKLPGLTNAIKLPEGVADLLKNSQTVAVTIQAKNGKIEIQLNLDAKNNANAAKVSLPFSADKVSQMIKQGISQTPNLPMKVDSNSAANSSKVVLPNQQQITLPGKVPPGSEAKIQNLSQHQIAVKITPAQITAKQLAAVVLDRPLPTLTASKPEATATPLAKTTTNLKPMLETLVQTVKLSAEKTLSAITDKPELAQPALAQQPPTIDLKTQKQMLDKLIDPLIRLLLPKKISWTEGLKSLATLEQQLPQTKSAAGKDELPQLKQVLNQLSRSIPDQNSSLTEKNISTIISQLINFNPAKVSPSIQPTPANAIANALQLLLGSKLVQQSETKATPQLLQQLTALLKPLTDKEGKTPAGMKALTTAIAQTEQGSNSLKTLVGLQSGIRHQQLENVEKKLDGNTQLNLTLPLKLDDEIKEVKIAISEEASKNKKPGKKNSIWQLNLTFDLSELGKLLVNAKLKDGEVSMHLYAEQQKTLTLMEKFSSILEKRLETQGVKINNIQSSLGKIDTPKNNKPLNSILQITI